MTAEEWQRGRAETLLSLAIDLAYPRPATASHNVVTFVIYDAEAPHRVVDKCAVTLSAAGLHGINSYPISHVATFHLSLAAFLEFFSSANPLRPFAVEVSGTFLAPGDMSILLPLCLRQDSRRFPRTSLNVEFELASTPFGNVAVVAEIIDGDVKVLRPVRRGETEIQATLRGSYWAIEGWLHHDLILRDLMAAGHVRFDGSVWALSTVVGLVWDQRDGVRSSASCAMSALARAKAGPEWDTIAKAVLERC